MSTMLKNKSSRAQNSSFKKLLFALTGIFGFCFAVFFAANAFFKSGFLYSAAITFGVTFYHFAIRLIIGCITDKVFRERTNPNSKWFSQKKFEHIVYKKLKVHKWKRFVPTYDPDQFNLEYHSFEGIARSMCSAEICHEVIMLFAMFPVLLIIPFGSPAVFIMTSFLSALIDLVFVIIQRYNRPRILRLIKRKA